MARMRHGSGLNGVVVLTWSPANQVRITEVAMMNEMRDCRAEIGNLAAFCGEYGSQLR